ncbi:MAG: hypothetical protein Kow001_01570 [Acidobacteriota bacterium]
MLGRRHSFLPGSLVCFVILLVLSPDGAYGQGCSYFSETFTGTASNSWRAANGQWTYGNNRLNVTGIAGDSLAYAEAPFSPSDFFVLDVDFQLSSPSGSGAVAIYPFTEGDVFLGVGERIADGVGALFFASGNAYLLGWDVGEAEWFQSPAFRTTGSVTSLGVRYSAGEIVLRINRADTTLKFTGQFQLAPAVMEKLWLMALGSDTTAWFDNVCAGPAAPPAIRTLTVTRTGSGRGTVTSNPAGISCGNTCSAGWAQGTVVTLTAAAESGSSFAGWSGGGCSGTGTCRVTLNADTTVSARFEADTPPQTDPDGVTWYFPYYQGGGSAFTAFAVSNGSTRPATVEFRAYGSDGKLLAFPRNPRSLALKAREQIAQLGHEIFGVTAQTTQSGWVELHSDNADIGTFFQVGTGDGKELDGSVPFSEAYRRLIFTRVHHGSTAFRGKSSQTLISLANPNAHAVTFNLFVYGSGTSQLLAERRNVTIPAHGMLFGPVHTLAGKSLNVTSGYAVVEVTAGDGLVGFELIQLADARTRIGLSAWGGNLSHELYSAQLAHLSGFFTSIKLVNTGTSSRRLTFRAVGESGAVLAQVTDRKLNPGEALELDAGQIFGWTAAQTVVGSLQVIADGSGVVGDVVFGDATRLTIAAAMPLQNRLLTRGTFSQVAQLPGFYTGLAFYNPGSATANITVEAFRADGVRSGVTQPPITLAAGRRVSKLLNEYLGSGFQQAGGYILVQSDQPLIAQQLFGSAAVLSAVPPGVQRTAIAGPGGSYLVPADQSDRSGAKTTLSSSPTDGLAEAGQTLRSGAVRVSTSSGLPLTGDGYFKLSVPLTSTPTNPDQLLLNVKTRGGTLVPVLGRYNAATRAYEVETPGLDDGWVMAVVESPGMVGVAADSGTTTPAGWLTDPEWETCEFFAVNHNNAATVAQIRNTHLPTARSVCQTLSGAGFRSPRLYLDRRRNPAARIVHIKNNVGSMFTSSLPDQDPKFVLSDLNEDQMLLLGQMYVDPQQLAQLNASYGVTLGNIFSHELFHAVQWGYDIRFRYVNEGTDQNPVWRSPLKAYYEGTATALGQTYQQTSSVTGPTVHVRALHGGEFAILDEQIDDFRTNYYTKQDFFVWIARKYGNNSLAYIERMLEQMGLDTTGRYNLSLDEYLVLYRQAADVAFRNSFSKGYSELYAEFALDRLYRHSAAALLRTAETANFKVNKFSDTLIKAAASRPQIDPESTDAAKRQAVFASLKPLTTVVALIPVSTTLAQAGSVPLTFEVTSGEVKQDAVRITIFKEDGNGVMLAGGEIPVSNISRPIDVPVSAAVKRLTVIISNTYLQNKVVKVTVTAGSGGACPGGAPYVIPPGERWNFEISLVNTADVKDCPPWEDSSLKNVTRRVCVFLQDGKIQRNSQTCYSHPQEVSGVYDACSGNLSFDFKLYGTLGTWADWAGTANGKLEGVKINGTWTGVQSYTYEGKPCERSLSGYIQGK